MSYQKIHIGNVTTGTLHIPAKTRSGVVLWKLRLPERYLSCRYFLEILYYGRTSHWEYFLNTSTSSISQRSLMCVFRQGV